MGRAVIVVLPLVETLKRQPLFQHLRDDDLLALAAAGVEEQRDGGEVVCIEGTPADTFFMILEGRVHVERHGEGTAGVELATLEAGWSFGEPALFDASVRSATVRALQPSRFFVLSRERFLDFLFEHPRALASVMSGVGSQIRAAHQKSYWDLLHAQSVRAELEEERYRALAELVAGVAHEVNTPLGVVATAVSILAERLGELDRDPSAAADAETRDDLREAVRLAQSNLTRANRLVESFKDLSARQAVVSVEANDLGAVIEDVLSSFAPQARASGLSCHFRDARSDPTRRWVGDAGAVTQILMNLLSNVQRYAYPQERGGRVDVVLEDGDGCLVLTVRDYGAGIPAHLLERVFEPFFTTGRARGGTGLGLAVVHSLATAIPGGSVSVDSAPGRGTAVRVVLPLRPTSGRTGDAQEVPP